jgi:hypothetical protein
MGEYGKEEIQAMEAKDEKDELAMVPMTTITKSGKLRSEGAAEQRETYGRGIAKGLFSAMQEDEFKAKVGLRLDWKKEKADLDKEVRSHRKTMPSTSSIFGFAKELVNAMGGDLEGRDDPQDTMTWEILSLVIARDIQLANFHPEIAVTEIPNIVGMANGQGGESIVAHERQGDKLI